MISSLWHVDSSESNYRSDTSRSNSRNLQIRYAKMHDVDWDDLRFPLAVSERSSMSRVAEFLNAVRRCRLLLIYP